MLAMCAEVDAHIVSPSRQFREGGGEVEMSCVGPCAEFGVFVCGILVDVRVARHSPLAWPCRVLSGAGAAARATGLRRVTTH